MKLKYFIDSNKGVTWIVMLALMAIYHQWQNPTAWIYLALHGTYGILWVLKSRIFPDAAWENRTSLWFGIVAWVGLVTYWIPGWLVASRGVQAPAWLMGLCICLFALGVFFHFATDMQKHTSLKLQPDALIVDGMMALSRNTNFFGELLIYVSFALLAMTLWAFVPLTLAILIYWIPRMLKKEKALAAMAGYEAYRKKTKAFFPFLF
jgi:protein-S-isoprenylcysteine O-methyltransferase Ste14